jgi:hypothetical protein
MKRYAIRGITTRQWTKYTDVKKKELTPPNFLKCFRTQSPLEPTNSTSSGLHVRRGQNQTPKVCVSCQRTTRIVPVALWLIRSPMRVMAGCELLYTSYRLNSPQATSICWRIQVKSDLIYSSYFVTTEQLLCNNCYVSLVHQVAACELLSPQNNSL